MNRANHLQPGWISTRLADAFDINLGKMLSPEASVGIHLKPYLANRNVQWNKFALDDLGLMSFSPSESQRFRLVPGDLLVCEGGEIGRTAIWSGELRECYFQKALHRLRPKRQLIIEPRFMLHYMRYIVDKAPLVDLVGQTSIAHLTREKLALLKVEHPVSVHEQQHIVDILDTADEQIRVAERSTAKLVALRDATIRESMLPGLRCFCELQASELYSGAHRSFGSWSLAPLGSLLSGIDAGLSPDLEDTPAGPGQWGVLKVSAVGNGGFRPEENKVVFDQTLYNSAICVRPGDLLITRANTTQLVGLSCIVENTPPHLMLCDKTLRLRMSHPYADAKYVAIALGLAEIRHQIETAATGTSGSMKNISQQAIRQLMIPLGSPADVDQMVNIDAVFRKQLAANRKEIGQLHALKHGLADDLLAGRVRVRGSGPERVRAG